MLTTITTHILELVEVWGLLILAVIFVFKGALIAKPLPTTAIVAGYIATISPVTVAEGLLVAAFIAFWYAMGEVPVFLVVSAYGVAAVNRIPLVRIDTSQVERAGRWFDTYGDPVVVVGSIIPVMRAAVFLTAAMADYPLWRVFAASLFGFFLYIGLIVLSTIGVISLL